MLAIVLALEASWCDWRHLMVRVSERWALAARVGLSEGAFLGLSEGPFFQFLGLITRDVLEG